MRTAELAYFKTHYYGGIRKYQWVTMPLELHGVVALTGRHQRARVNIGADAGDPRLVITDLLPHLGAEQNKKPLGEARPRRDAEPAAGQPPHRTARRSRPGEAGGDAAAEREVRHHRGRLHLRGAGGGARGEGLRTSAWTAA